MCKRADTLRMGQCSTRLGDQFHLTNLFCAVLSGSNQQATLLQGRCREHREMRARVRIRAFRALIMFTDLLSFSCSFMTPPIFRQVAIFEKQTEAEKRADKRVDGLRLETIENEGRERHMADMIGLVNAASDQFKLAASKIVAKHKSTQEYEIRTGLALMLELDTSKSMSLLNRSSLLAEVPYQS